MSQFEEPNFERLPAHMQAGAERYIMRGVPPGHFLTAILCNDLAEAFNRADLDNQKAMKDWTMWLYNDIPTSAHGSPEAVKEWIAAGGIEGQEE